MKDLYSEMRKELVMKMKFMDPTIKGIEGSLEDREASLYNDGIREAIGILDKYKDRLMGR